MQAEALCLSKGACIITSINTASLRLYAKPLLHIFQVKPPENKAAKKGYSSLHRTVQAVKTTPDTFLLHAFLQKIKKAALHQLKGGKNYELVVPQGILN